MDREHTLVQTPSQGELTEEYGALSWSITAEDSGPEDSDNEQGPSTSPNHDPAIALHLRPTNQVRNRSHSFSIGAGADLLKQRLPATPLLSTPKQSETTDDQRKVEECVPKPSSSPSLAPSTPPSSGAKDSRPEWYEELSEEQIAMFKEVFEMLDRDGGGSLDAAELYNVMSDMQLDVTKEEIEAVLKELDKDGNGEIDFDEFLYTMCDTARLIDIMAEDPERAQREEENGYSRRQRLFFTAITRFAIKNSMGEIERYYAGKMRQAPHVISFYTAGVRLIGLNDRQLELRLRKMQKESRGNDSPYAKPLPFVTVRPRKRKNKAGSKDNPPRGSSPSVQRRPVSPKTPTMLSRRGPSPKTQSRANPSKSKKGNQPMSVAAQKLGTALASLHEPKPEKTRQRKVSFQDSPPKPPQQHKIQEPIEEEETVIPAVSIPVPQQISKPKTQSKVKGLTIDFADMNEKLSKLSMLNQNNKVEYTADYGAMTNKRDRSFSLPYAWNAARTDEKPGFNPNDDILEEESSLEPTCLGFSGSAVQIKESYIAPLRSNSNEGDLLSVPSVAARRQSVQRRRTAIHSDSLEYGEVMKLLQDLAKQGSVVAKLPDVHLIPGIRNRLAAMSGEAEETSYVDPLCSSVRRRRRTMPEFNADEAQAKAATGGRKLSRQGKLKDEKSAKTTQGWAIPRYIRSRPPLPVIPLTGAHDMSKCFTVDDVPMVRAKVSKALGKYYDKLKNAYVRTDWAHWDHLNKFITSEKLRENFKQVYCAYSPHQVENVFVITPWIPGPRYTSRQPGKAITHQGNPPRSSSCVPPPVSAGQTPRQQSRPGSSLL